MTKYDFDFSHKEFEKEINRLTNQLWKLIPMRENEEDWVRQLETVIVEIAGLNEIILINSSLLELLEILEGLKISDIDFSVYRKLVFESISLLRRLVQNA